MSRHDWSVLGLIGLCAFGGLTMTAALAARRMTPLPCEPSFFETAPIEVLQEPAEAVEPVFYEVTEEGMGRVTFRSPWGAFPHASYGLTLRSRPMEFPLYRQAPKGGIRYKHRPPVRWVPSPSYDILFQEKETPLWNPSERFD